MANFLEEVEIVEAANSQQNAIRPPSKFHVFLLNDDFTPMDFVVTVLKKFFHMTHDRAVTTMLEVHETGKGICGTFTYDIAITKKTSVTSFSRKNDYPLICVVEKPF